MQIQPQTFENLTLLKLKHSEWDRLLREELKRPAPDPLVVQNLKKHKFALKQEITKLEKILLGS